MLWLWITLCLILKGTNSFMIHNTVESLCLEDSIVAGVQLKRCSVDLELQQWVWTDRVFLMNVGTKQCLSVFHTDQVQTRDCDGEDDLQWQCMNHRLISLSYSLELGVRRGSLTLTNKDECTKWKSLDQGDICQEKLRSRRQSVKDVPSVTVESMTEEEREYLRWYYRTEDATPWKFAMLGFSFVALLLGCVLCVMGMMGNKHRREISKYKNTTAASLAGAKVEKEELQVINEINEDKVSYTDQTKDEQLPPESASEIESLKPGEIVLSWKDGNISKLNSNSQDESEEDK